MAAGRERGRGRGRRGAPQPAPPNAVEAISHLKLSQLGLRSLRGVRACKGLTALYAYENELEELDDFSSGNLRRLETMHLESNKLTSAALSGGLEGLVGLKSLHVDKNRITLLAGLEHCPRLETLTITDQRAAEPLAFSEMSLFAAGASLRSLDVSGTGVTTLRPFQALGGLEKLLCERNECEDMTELAELLRGCRWLAELSLKDNPIAALRNYRHKAIAVSQPSLRLLDGAEVTAKQRDFLLRLELRKRGIGSGQGVGKAAARQREDGMPGRMGGGTSSLAAAGAASLGGARGTAARAAGGTFGGGFVARGPRAPPGVTEDTMAALDAARERAAGPAKALGAGEPTARRAAAPRRPGLSRRRTGQAAPAPVPSGPRGITPAAGVEDRDLRTPWGRGPGAHRDGGGLGPARPRPAASALGHGFDGAFA